MEQDKAAKQQTEGYAGLGGRRGYMYCEEEVVRLEQTRNAIFEPSMPSQIRWAVSPLAKVRHGALSMVGLFLCHGRSCLSHVALRFSLFADQHCFGAQRLCTRVS